MRNGIHLSWPLAGGMRFPKSGGGAEGAVAAVAARALLGGDEEEEDISCPSFTLLLSFAPLMLTGVSSRVLLLCAVDTTAVEFCRCAQDTQKKRYTYTPSKRERRVSGVAHAFFLPLRVPFLFRKAEVRSGIRQT